MPSTQHLIQSLLRNAHTEVLSPAHSSAHGYRKDRGTVGWGFPSCCAHRTYSAPRMLHMMSEQQRLLQKGLYKENLLGAQRGQESRWLRGEVRARCLVEAASELSLEGQKNQTSKMKWEGNSRQRGQPGQRVGGGKEHSVCRERHQPAWQVRGLQNSRWAGQTSGLGPEDRDLLQRRECTEWGIPGTVAATWMAFKEERALLSPLQ